MTRVSFLSHDIIKESPNVYPPYLYGGIGNLFPGYPPYPHETTGYWLHLTNRLTFTQCNVVTTRQLTNTARDRHCGQILKRGWIYPPRTAHDMITVCLLLFRALILNSTRTSRRLNLRPIKKTRWKKSRQVKGTWLISDRMTASYPQFHRFLSHFNRLMRRRNMSTGHSLEFPSPRVIEWHRGFYTSREMTVHVCYYFQLSGIIILAFKRTANTK